MKYIIKYKELILTLVIMFIIGFYNIAALRKVSILEKDLANLKTQLEDKEKELDKKMIYYDQKLNLAKIRENMEKKSMTVAKDIIYFEIDDAN